MIAKSLNVIFHEMADLLELSGENVFKVRAYRKAAEIMMTLREETLHNASRKELRDLPGIGDAISEKIIEFRESGQVSAHENMKAGIPPGVIDLLRVPSLGPKTVRKLWIEYGVKDVKNLRVLLKGEKAEDIPGFGKKKIENIFQGLELSSSMNTRMPYEEAEKLASGIIQHLKKCASVELISTAGSLRRKSGTLGDIDILVSSHAPEEVISFFVNLPGILQVTAEGGTKASVITKEKHQVDLRVVPPESYGSALQYFTGSKEHNILLRKIALKKGLKLSEYGVFRGTKKRAGETEEGVYKILGVKWIPPEKRMGKDELF